MTYLLDSNVFIQAKNDSNDIENFSTFLKWLELKNQEGIVHSIDKVFDELQKGNDILTTWSRCEGKDLFKNTEYPDIYPIIRKIHIWLKDQNFPEFKIKEFSDCADIWLVSHAILNNYTVVSLEDRISRGKIKIPVVCDEFKVTCITTDDMLNLENFRL